MKESKEETWESALGRSVDELQNFNLKKKGSKGALGSGGAEEDVGLRGSSYIVVL